MVEINDLIISHYAALYIGYIAAWISASLTNKRVDFGIWMPVVLTIIMFILIMVEIFVI